MNGSGRVVAFVPGAGFIAALTTDRAALLVRPWFLPVLLATGVVLILAGWKAPHKVTPTMAAILLLPVVVGASLSPAQAARVFADSGQNAQLQPRLGEQTNPILSSDATNVTLLDIYLAEREVGGVALAGRPVTVEAMVTSDDRISRSVMVCCAADARPVTLRVDGELPSVGSWARITGRLSTEGSELYLEATNVEPIPTPARPFL